LSVRDLSGYFGAAQDSPALKSVSFDIRPGRMTAVVGETGSGKSLTFLLTLGVAPKSFHRTSGGIFFDGEDLLSLGEDRLRSIRGRRISIVFQDARTALNPVFTVGRQLTDLIRLHHRVGRAEGRRRAIAALERVQIPEPERRAGQYPHQFSGGMAQRVMIAMALACNPELLVLDEPTTGLDVTIQAEIMELISTLTADGMTACLITHDLGIVAETCDDVVVMRRGEVVESSTVEQLFTAPRHEYTRSLLAASRLTEEVAA
jgi:ABC-type dipeptide/oligopeptide/nickel transport system ATPase component